METIEGELFPASLLHNGDIYIDLAEGRTFRAVEVTRTGNGWHVQVVRDDDTVQRYYMSEHIRVVL